MEDREVKGDPSYLIQTEIGMAWGLIRNTAGIQQSHLKHDYDHRFRAIRGGPPPVLYK